MLVSFFPCVQSKLYRYARVSVCVSRSCSEHGARNKNSDFHGFAGLGSGNSTSPAYLHVHGTFGLDRGLRPQPWLDRQTASCFLIEPRVLMFAHGLTAVGHGAHNQKVQNRIPKAEDIDTIFQSECYVSVFRISIFQSYIAFKKKPPYRMYPVWNLFSLIPTNKIT
ncbi:hypothetical protein BT96DRAFT_520646 [Gymnopus androsaceus JB14]|uniref:Uncharacterized protein n=1 Tax=Gymnopus androsaceus JB14 TaxID=1447944 RepID=A0A6A4HUC3_9AGAR|nr:hypothetical protein BT96DRAFT_520646 [Gymnopus androsaceus JB14]